MAEYNKTKITKSLIAAALELSRLLTPIIEQEMQNLDDTDSLEETLYQKRKADALESHENPPKKKECKKQQEPTPSLLYPPNPVYEMPQCETTNIEHASITEIQNNSRNEFSPPQDTKREMANFNHAYHGGTRNKLPQLRATECETTNINDASITKTQNKPRNELSPPRGIKRKMAHFNHESNEGARKKLAPPQESQSEITNVNRASIANTQNKSRNELSPAQETKREMRNFNKASNSETQIKQRNNAHPPQDFFCVNLLSDGEIESPPEKFQYAWVIWQNRNMLMDGYRISYLRQCIKSAKTVYNADSKNAEKINLNKFIRVRKGKFRVRCKNDAIVQWLRDVIGHLATESGENYFVETLSDQQKKTFARIRMHDQIPLNPVVPVKSIIPAQTSILFHNNLRHVPPVMPNSMNKQRNDVYRPQETKREMANINHASNSGFQNEQRNKFPSPLEKKWETAKFNLVLNSRTQDKQRKKAPLMKSSKIKVVAVATKKGDGRMTNEQLSFVNHRIILASFNHNRNPIAAQINIGYTVAKDGLLEVRYENELTLKWLQKTVERLPAKNGDFFRVISLPEPENESPPEKFQYARIIWQNRYTIMDADRISYLSRSIGNANSVYNAVSKYAEKIDVVNYISTSKGKFLVRCKNDAIVRWLRDVVRHLAIESGENYFVETSNDQQKTTYDWIRTHDQIPLDSVHCHFVDKVDAYEKNGDESKVVPVKSIIPAQPSISFYNNLPHIPPVTPNLMNMMMPIANEPPPVLYPPCPADETPRETQREATNVERASITEIQNRSRNDFVPSQDTKQNMANFNHASHDRTQSKLPLPRETQYETVNVNGASIIETQNKHRNELEIANFNHASFNRGAQKKISPLQESQSEITDVNRESIANTQNKPTNELSPAQETKWEMKNFNDTSNSETQIKQRNNAQPPQDFFCVDLLSDSEIESPPEKFQYFSILWKNKYTIMDAGRISYLRRSIQNAKNVYNGDSKNAEKINLDKCIRTRKGKFRICCKNDAVVQWLRNVVGHLTTESGENYFIQPDEMKHLKKSIECAQSHPEPEKESPPEKFQYAYIFWKNNYTIMDSHRITYLKQSLESAKNVYNADSKNAEKINLDNCITMHKGKFCVRCKSDAVVQWLRDVVRHLEKTKNGENYYVYPHEMKHLNKSIDCTRFLPEPEIESPLEEFQYACIFWKNKNTIMDADRMSYLLQSIESAKNVYNADSKNTEKINLDYCITMRKGKFSICCKNYVIVQWLRDVVGHLTTESGENYFVEFLNDPQKKTIGWIRTLYRIPLDPDEMEHLKNSILCTRDIYNGIPRNIAKIKLEIEKHRGTLHLHSRQMSKMDALVKWASNVLRELSQEGRNYFLQTEQQPGVSGENYSVVPGARVHRARTPQVCKEAAVVIIHRKNEERMISHIAAGLRQSIISAAKSYNLSNSCKIGVIVTLCNNGELHVCCESKESLEWLHGSVARLSQESGVEYAMTLISLTGTEEIKQESCAGQSVVIHWKSAEEHMDLEMITNLKQEFKRAAVAYNADSSNAKKINMYNFVTVREGKVCICCENATITDWLRNIVGRLSRENGEKYFMEIYRYAEPIDLNVTIGCGYTIIDEDMRILIMKHIMKELNQYNRSNETELKFNRIQLECGCLHFDCADEMTVRWLSDEIHNVPKRWIGADLEMQKKVSESVEKPVETAFAAPGMNLTVAIRCRIGDGLMSDFQLSLIERSVMEAVNAHNRNPAKRKVKVNGYEAFCGLLHVHCGDEATATWLKATVVQMSEMQSGAKLLVIPVHLLKKHAYSTIQTVVCVDGKAEDVSKVIARLDSQNEGLNVKNWDVWNYEYLECLQKHAMVFGIPTSDYEELMKRKQKLHFAFGHYKTLPLRV